MDHIFNLSTAIISFSIIFINLLWLRFNKRKRKYGLIPGYLLCITFIAFLGGLAYVLAFIKEDKRRFQDEVVINKSYGNEKYQTEMKRKMFIKKYENENSGIITYLHLSMRCCTVQSLMG